MTPKVEIIALADLASYTKEGKFNIVGIFDEIYPKKLPSTFTRSYLAFTLIMDQSDHHDQIKITITDPKNKTTIKQEVTIYSGRNKKANYFLQIDGLPISIEGIYTITLTYKDKKIGSTNFLVKQIEGGQTNVSGNTRSN